MSPDDVPGMSSPPLTPDGERNARYLIVWALSAPVVFGVLNALMGLTVAALGTAALSLVGVVWAWDRRTDERRAALSGPGGRPRQGRSSPR